MQYIDSPTLKRALGQLWGTAHHMLKIWLVLKQMGMRSTGGAVTVTTQNPTDALQRLFGYGNPDGKFYVPFADTERFATMKSEASRSVIQTNIRRWQASGSVVGVDPSGYLDFDLNNNDEVLVRPGRNYPVGLGHGENGFALGKEVRLAVPEGAFAVWYGRRESIPSDSDALSALTIAMRSGLGIDAAEASAVFASRALDITTQKEPLTDDEINEIVSSFLGANPEPMTALLPETFSAHVQRIKTMVSLPDGPRWLRVDPDETVATLIQDGCSALLLYGPPRTGKTRAVDKHKPRTDPTRETIQIHDGWGYDELMIGLRPGKSGAWEWKSGALLKAVHDGKKVIVLEEINRTNFTQALGEAFSLLEPQYRGENNKIRLRNDEAFFIPADVLLVATMNTLDKSTEEIDDALLGRFSAVEFPPRVEALMSMLMTQSIAPDVREKLCRLFALIQQRYPLGHGYFADFKPTSDPIRYYLARIRPVLQSHLRGLRDDDLAAIDNEVDALFGKP